MTKPSLQSSSRSPRAKIVVLTITVLSACVIAWTDRRFYLNAGYSADIRPSYWPHAVLLAGYAGAAFALARAPIWKTALVVLAALSFGIWSVFVVTAALDPGTLPPPLPSIASGVDAFAGRAGSGSLFLGVTAGGLATAGWFGVLTKRFRVGLWIAGATLIAALLAVLGWGEALGPVSNAALMASSVLWHTATAGTLLLAWRSPPSERA